MAIDAINGTQGLNWGVNSTAYDTDAATASQIDTSQFSSVLNGANQSTGGTTGSTGTDDAQLQQLLQLITQLLQQLQGSDSTGGKDTETEQGKTCGTGQGSGGSTAECGK